MQRGRWSAAALFTACLIISAGGSRAWFLAPDEAETTTESPADTATAADATPTASTAADAGKVQEASPEHRRIVEQNLLRLAQSTQAPEPDHETKAYWPADQLPAWLPHQVRQQFELDNQESVRQRIGVLRTSLTTATPAVEHVTRDYWENFPNWVNLKVKEEIQRENREFVRRLSNTGTEADATTEPPAEHVTRTHWEALPSWLNADVRRQFELDNRMAADQMFGRANSQAAATTQAAFEHVTRDYWENLPAWLPKQVRDELATENRRYMMRLAGIEESTLPPRTTPATPLPTTESRRRPSVVRVASRRIESAELRQPQPSTEPPTQPPTQPPTPPMRQISTVKSSEQLPPKCRQQLDWRNQPKCSSSRSKWTFDLVEMKCKWFAHYGCQLDNGNIFNSLTECQNYCVRGILDPCEVVRCKKYTLYQSRCFLLEDAECRDRVMRNYSYILDVEVRRVLAEDDVLLKCQPPVARCINTAPEVGHPSFESSPTYIHAASLPAHCELPQDRGFCYDKSRVRLARVYFYSKRQNQCKFMVNFGCSRNQNYFNSLADCYNSCGL